MKKKMLIALCIVIAIFIFSCNDETPNPKETPDPKCECTKGEYHKGECDPVCPNGKGNAPCTHAAVCECPEGTIHFIGDTMQCASEKDCNCEHGNFAGARASNGIAITNRGNAAMFDTIVERINEALDHEQLSSEDRKNFIKNGITEIRIVQKDEIVAPTAPVGGIFIIECTSGSAPSALNIRSALRTWCEANGLYVYLVYYRPNGATGDVKNQLYEPSVEFTISGKFNDWTYLGKTFKSWNTQENGDGTNYAAGTKIKVDNVLSESITLNLYAQWE